MDLLTFWMIFFWFSRESRPSGQGSFSSYDAGCSSSFSSSSDPGSGSLFLGSGLSDEELLLDDLYDIGYNLIYIT